MDQELENGDWWTIVDKNSKSIFRSTLLLIFMRFLRFLIQAIDPSTECYSEFLSIRICQLPWTQKKRVSIVETPGIPRIGTGTSKKIILCMLFNSYDFRRVCRNKKKTGQCLVQIYFSYPFFILPSYLVIYTSIIKIHPKILSLYNAIFRSMLI